MEKHLVQFGNSLGIVIDRPICKLLRINTRTPLSISTDGRRIVIEPVEMPAMPPADQLDAVRVVSNVAYDMPVELHERMHPALTGRGACTRAISWAERVSAKPRPGDELFVRRYRVCLDAHNAGASWRDAVDKAICEVVVPDEVLETARAASVR